MLRMVGLPALVFMASGIAFGQNAPTDDQTKKDLEGFNAYLKKNYPAASSLKAVRLKGEELDKAYPKLRFYAARTGAGSGAAAAPGSNRLPSFMTISVSFDDKGSLVPRYWGGATDGALPRPDLNAGLVPIKSESDAKIAAVAISELIAWKVPAKDIKVTAVRGGGWRCEGNNRFWNLVVTFDAKGKCAGATSRYQGPLPPAAAGRVGS